VLVHRARKHALDPKTLCLQGFFTCRARNNHFRSLFVMHASRVHKMQQNAFNE